MCNTISVFSCYKCLCTNLSTNFGQSLLEKNNQLGLPVNINLHNSSFVVYCGYCDCLIGLSVSGVLLVYAPQTCAKLSVPHLPAKGTPL